MKKVTAELLPLAAMTPPDTHDFVEWVTSIRNNFDPEVMGYPRTVLCRAKAGDEPIAYVPLHAVLMYESLAPRPGTSALQLAQGLREISAVADQAAAQTGHGENYFLTNSEEEMKLCVKRGWKVRLYDPERKEWLLRRKVPAMALLDRGRAA